MALEVVVEAVTPAAVVKTAGVAVAADRVTPRALQPSDLGTTGARCMQGRPQALAVVGTERWVNQSPPDQTAETVAQVSRGSTASRMAVAAVVDVRRAALLRVPAEAAVEALEHSSALEPRGLPIPEVGVEAHPIT